MTKIINAKKARSLAQNYNERYTKRYVMESINRICQHGGTYARLPKEDFECSWEWIVDWITTLGYKCHDNGNGDIIISWSEGFVYE